ncbi:MAG TPA: ferritin family protein [Patescibacteria group bacterium]|nr:ferritin family protein [Patescibacteria group bacterium]
MARHDSEMKMAIEGAIYREIGARDFYRTIAEGIQNAEGKEKFSRLSEDEDGHRAKLESWLDRLFGESFSPQPDKLKESEIGGIGIDERTGALEALNIAIGAEEEAEAFYRNQAAGTDIPELRELLLGIADEEHGHFAMLEAERNSIIGGFYWFDMDSTSFLED